MPNTARPAVLAVLVVHTLACAHAPAPAAAPARTAPTAAASPRVDHHQHLLSPAGAALLNVALPGVAVPDDVRRLLVQREAKWNDREGLLPLYSDDAIVLTPEAPSWVRGRQQAAAYLATLFVLPYRITPVMWRSDGERGSLSGYFTRGEGADAWHFANVYFDLVRGADGTWRIASEIPAFPGPSQHEPVDAAALVAAMDDAGIECSIVLSDAYYFDAPETERMEESFAKMRAENDWTAAQVARFPDRLVAFCSVNPLKEYAVAELDRCAASGNFAGLKLHFDTSGVDLLDREHVGKVRQVFAAANRHRLPMLVHVARRSDPPYGVPHARAFVEQLIPAAPDVPIVIAHLWGGGPWSDDVMAVYGRAVAAGRNLYFEISGAARVVAGSREAAEAIANRIRAIGPSRFLFGSDGPLPGGMQLRDIWPQFARTIPLAPAELQTIADNSAPSLTGASRTACTTARR